MVKKLAHPFGVDVHTVSAWRRPKPSDLNPTGTGKGNPLDQAERLIRSAHPFDPASARAMADYFNELVNELDSESGMAEAHMKRHPCELLARSICEHADVASSLCIQDYSVETLHSALKEIKEAKVALLQLEGCIYGMLNDDVAG